MKLSALLLVGSVALNALLLACWWRSTPADLVDRAGVMMPWGPSRATTSRSSVPAISGLLAKLSPTALHAALREKNLPRDVCDAVVKTRIYRGYEARRRALFAETLGQPWWRTAAAGRSHLSLLHQDQRRELRKLEAEARIETLRLLGPQALDPDGRIALRHAFLPPEKAVLLDGLLFDYADFAETLRDVNLGIRTAADRDRETRLEDERRRDLEKLLQPEELERFDLRTHAFAQSLHSRWLGFQPTETEYRALLAAHESFAARYPAISTAERAAQPYRINQMPEFQAELRTLLGDHRYTEWKKSGQAHFRALESLSIETGVSADTARELGFLLSDTAAKSWEARFDAESSVDQKKALLAELASKARAELISKLGGAAATRLLRENVAWLDSIETGTAVDLRENGYSYMHVGSHPGIRR